jgi:hypothetical protein
LQTFIGSRSLKPELLVALKSMESHWNPHWKPTAVKGFSGDVPFLPFAQTVPGMAIGILENGAWALARYVSDPERPGLMFDPMSPKGLIYLTPLLDWTPRRVMNQVNVMAELAELLFEELWDEFPWRYAIRSGLAVARRYYHVDAALDWLAYLDVAHEFEPELRLLGIDTEDIKVPRPSIEEYRPSGSVRYL